MRVLVVDDDVDSAELLAELLNLEGFRPVRAGSVSEAIEALGEHAVRVVITDYSMPGEDGLELVRQIRSRPGWAHLPVIMISGHDLGGNVAEAARRLDAEFVPKPMDVEGLLGRVRRALGAAKDERGGAARLPRASAAPETVATAASADSAPVEVAESEEIIAAVEVTEPVEVGAPPAMVAGGPGEETRSE